MSDDLLDDARFIYVHLNHPCREIDVWRTTQPEEKRIALRQGYVSLVSLRQLVAENERLSKEYYELIFAVASKCPGETRHETALRYIQERERRVSGPSEVSDVSLY